MTALTRTTLASLPLLLAGSLACVPPKPTPLNPHFEPSMAVTRWERGRARVTQEEKHLAVIATFLEGAAGTLIFDIEVRNHGETSLVVTPEDLRCLVFHHPKAPPLTVLALDPEKEIRRIAEASHALDRQREVDSARNGTFALIGLATGVVATVDHARSPSTEKRIIAETGAGTLQGAVTAEAAQTDRHLAQRQALQTSRQPWEQDCLRRTTLEPGQGVHGRVVFQVDATMATQMRLKVPIGEHTFEFTYAPHRAPS